MSKTASNATNQIAVEKIERETGPNPTWTVIWLHGLGADGHDFEPVAPQLGFSDHPAVRFIFPHAPVRPITINGGMSMRGWYDIREMAINRQEDRAGLEQSQQIVESLIASENQRGIPAERIFLIGFSQGGAVSLFTGLRYAYKLAGIVALSTYLPDADSTEAERHAANNATPILMAHGTGDPIIPLAMAENSHETLQALGYQTEWLSYPMEHSVSMEEIQDIAGFLRRHIETD